MWYDIGWYDMTSPLTLATTQGTSISTRNADLAPCGREPQSPQSSGWHNRWKTLAGRCAECCRCFCCGLSQLIPFVNGLQRAEAQLPVTTRIMVILSMDFGEKHQILIRVPGSHHIKGGTKQIQTTISSCESSIESLRMEHLETNQTMLVISG